MTMVSREPRQIAGYRVSPNKAAGTIQQMVDASPAANRYCTDGYFGYLDVIFPGKHIFKEPLINHRYFITIDKSVRESSLSRAFPEPFRDSDSL